jgi:uncharacterized phage protein gp47/JayE
MTTYPLTTLAATIDSTGISAPSYADILASLKASAAIIFGSDVYLEADSQDGQLLAVFAQAINDCNTVAVGVYNQFSPATSQGAGLSSVVKINGLQRLVPSNSTANVTIVGQAGTTIQNGIIQDENGNQWSLPVNVVIPIGGSIIVTATCNVQGAITAAASTITSIITPTRGWQTVTNVGAAVPGNPVEMDFALRQRQSVSTELPAQSIIGGIFGALANLSGVQQLKIFENDTGTTDTNTVPPHSIAVVIEGGNAVAIAQTIEEKKTPGTGTYGSTTEIVEDEIGLPVTIHFYVPTQITIDVNVTIKALPGYQSGTGALIQAAIVAAINIAGINANNGLLSLSALEAVCYSVPNANTFNVTAFAMSRDPASPTAADITIAFNELPVTTTGSVNISVS